MKEKEEKERIKKELENIATAKLQLDKDWEPMEDNQNLKLVQVLNNTQEYNNINNEISKSLPNSNILKIERVQNKWLWKCYKNKIQFLIEKGVEENEKWLFHGTRTIEPEKIYNGEIGFDMRHSNNGSYEILIYLMLILIDLYCLF